MKIISNYKDYYDYLVGIYGVDQKVFYDRRLGGNPFDQCICVGHLFVLGKHYLVMPQKGALPIIALSELIAFYKKMSKDDSDRVQVFRPYLVKNTKWGKHGEEEIFITDYPPSPVNSELKCPVVYAGRYDFETKKADEITRNPKLDAIKFSRIIPAKEMYLGITEFLSYKEPELKTKPEDMTRFESKGFSKKTSFRKM